MSMEGGEVMAGSEPVSVRQHALNESIHGLKQRWPELSASRVFSPPQLAVLAVLISGVTLGLVLAPLLTGTILAAAVTALYTVMLVRNVIIFRRLSSHPVCLEVTDAEALSVPESALPVYTVLVAAYHEPEVIAATIEHLRRIVYPRDRLDIKVILEADDQATRRAFAAAAPPSHIELLLVPPAHPRTKPKALNYGLRSARGDYVTIYDAEDRPDPLQLRRAVVAFSSASAQVGCLQAKLEYHNPRQNLLTAWFSLEYLSWFGFVLPAIAAGRTPLPLGGTSMHIRRDILQEIGAWDPHNVTEDCDLGVRLYRMGYRTAILDSTTYEEANSDAINWVKQRSRWVKGYAQTWLVHTRHPLRTWRELGTRGFVGFNLLVGASTLLSVLNPALWTLTIVWFLVRPGIIQAVFPDWVYYPSMLCLIVGNFLAYYGGLVTLRVTGRAELLKAALLLPLYWILMSVGAIRAFLQLLISPFVWEKTVHGLDRAASEAR